MHYYWICFTCREREKKHSSPPRRRCKNEWEGRRKEESLPGPPLGEAKRLLKESDRIAFLPAEHSGARNCFFLGSNEERRKEKERMKADWRKEARRKWSRLPQKSYRRQLAKLPRCMYNTITILTMTIPQHTQQQQHQCFFFFLFFFDSLLVCSLPYSGKPRLLPFCVSA